MLDGMKVNVRRVFKMVGVVVGSVVAMLVAAVGGFIAFQVFYWQQPAPAVPLPLEVFDVEVVAEDGLPVFRVSRPSGPFEPFMESDEDVALVADVLNLDREYVAGQMNESLTAGGVNAGAAWGDGEGASGEAIDRNVVGFDGSEPQVVTFAADGVCPFTPADAVAVFNELFPGEIPWQAEFSEQLSGDTTDIYVLGRDMASGVAGMEKAASEFMYASTLVGAMKVFEDGCSLLVNGDVWDVTEVAVVSAGGASSFDVRTTLETIYADMNSACRSDVGRLREDAAVAFAGDSVKLTYLPFSPEFFDVAGGGWAESVLMVPSFAVGDVGSLLMVWVPADPVLAEQTVQFWSSTTEQFGC